MTQVKILERSSFHEDPTARSRLRGTCRPRGEASDRQTHMIPEPAAASSGFLLTSLI